MHLIAAERHRQIAAEGYSPEHDREHADGELAQAAIAYALLALELPDSALPWWPWDGPLKRGTAIRNLEKAGALIAAEIDRLLAAQGGRHG